jgi:hypothetical protein
MTDWYDFRLVVLSVAATRKVHGIPTFDINSKFILSLLHSVAGFGYGSGKHSISALPENSVGSSPTLAPCVSRNGNYRVQTSLLADDSNKVSACRVYAKSSRPLWTYIARHFGRRGSVPHT